MGESSMWNCVTRHDMQQLAPRFFVLLLTRELDCFSADSIDSLFIVRLRTLGGIEAHCGSKNIHERFLFLLLAKRPKECYRRSFALVLSAWNVNANRMRNYATWLPLQPCRGARPVLTITRVSHDPHLHGNPNYCDGVLHAMTWKCNVSSLFTQQARFINHSWSRDAHKGVNELSTMWRALFTRLMCFSCCSSKAWNVPR